MGEKFPKSKILLLLSSVFIILIILDIFTNFAIKNTIIRNVSYGFTIISVFYWLILQVLKCKNRLLLKVFWWGLSILFLPVFLLLFLISQEHWQTQTIIYENKISPNQAIEHQMKDTDALGYASRTVQVTYFTPIFMLIKPVDENNINPQEWIKVNKNIDEMGIGEY